MTKKIVCAVDNTDYSKPAIVMAAELAKAMEAELALVSVNEIRGGVGRMGAVTYMLEDAELSRILETSANEARAAGISNPKTITLKSRDVGRAIAIYAEESGADHIVVGTGGKGSMSQLILGSVSRDVVSRAHCPVTVAR